MTCKSLESSHEQPWAGWWRRSVAGAALAWTAVCAAFSAKRARSEILFMSSCHSNSFYAWKIFPEMSKMGSLRWSWCMVAVSQSTASQPESRHYQSPCHWDYWLHPTHKKTSDSWASANKVAKNLGLPLPPSRADVASWITWFSTWADVSR